jgi:hypothetical protein
MLAADDGEPPVPPRSSGLVTPSADRVNALPHADVRFYDDRAAARYILCIRKEVLAMFANRQTPPGVAL